MAGIEGNYELPEQADTDVFLLSDMERRILGIESLPSSLSQALETMQRSELVAETLGEDCFDYFLRDKRHEWEQYRQQITPAERRHFLATY